MGLRLDRCMHLRKNVLNNFIPPVVRYFYRFLSRIAFHNTVDLSMHGILCGRNVLLMWSYIYIYMVLGRRNKMNNDKSCNIFYHIYSYT